MRKNPCRSRLVLSIPPGGCLLSKRFAKSNGLFLNNGIRISRAQVTKIVKTHLSLVTTAEHLSPHILRHSFATAMLNNGAEIEAVKELLGHTSLGTTQIYTHTTFEELKKIYTQAHPRGGEKSQLKGNERK